MNQRNSTNELAAYAIDALLKSAGIKEKSIELATKIMNKTTDYSKKYFSKDQGSIDAVAKSRAKFKARQDEVRARSKILPQN